MARDEQAWAKVRTLKQENDRLRIRAHERGHALWHRNKELEAQLDEHRASPWTYLPWKGYVS